MRATRMPRAGQRATLFAVGYVSVWTAISLALFAMSTELSAIGMASPTDPPFAPWAGAVVLCVGILQRSRWKAKQLVRCRTACVTARAPTNVMTAWRDGYRLGVDCGLSCAAPMAVLVVAGLMDARMMVLITAAITAERVAPAGVRIARLTGSLALVAGLVMWARAIDGPSASSRHKQALPPAPRNRHDSSIPLPRIAMTIPTQDTVVRRSFLARLAAIGGALTVALPSTASAQSSRAPTHPADAWLDDLKGQHKNIFDCISIENASSGWAFARNFLTANTGPIYQLKDADINVIVCVRHLASVFGFNDAMWAKYKLGESQKVNEGGVAAVKNPHATTANDLAKRGVIVAVCGMATTRISRAVATESGLNAADIEADLRANLVTPTARVVAAGVIVTNRAQEKGFTYTYVG
jgi:intracellular sulfur oxidation DsrE/DsrF family protein